MKFSLTFLVRLTSAAALIFIIGVSGCTGKVVAARSLPGDDISPKAPAIVFGFLGGFVAHDDPVHAEVQLAAQLRKEFPTGVEVETFENTHVARARQQILKFLDTDRDGMLSKEEKQSARIIIYGHSWGGWATVALARALEKDGIPVLLTIQVDSVSKRGRNDTLIPANVAQAVNYYQPFGIVHGDHDIKAADATRTRILGNYRFDYKKSPLNCADYPWYDRFFVKPHTQIECDPEIWAKAESLIRANLPQIPAKGSK
jgi:pimeloyl-ACP methyl ester carboxylesterase